MRFAKPLDIELLTELAHSHDIIVTVEENAIMGGAGCGVMEVLQKLKIIKPVLQIGLPDEFIKHGAPDEIISELKLDAAGIEQQIRDYIN